MMESILSHLMQKPFKVQPKERKSILKNVYAALSILTVENDHICATINAIFLHLENRLMLSNFMVFCVILELDKFTKTIKLGKKCTTMLKNVGGNGYRFVTTQGKERLNNNNYPFISVIVLFADHRWNVDWSDDLYS